MPSSSPASASARPQATAEAISVAVVLPCHNEASAIGDVVQAFRRALPQARVYAVDNASEDATAAVASAAGAIVVREPQKGKGNAVRRAFASIDADVYVMADGDGTYDAERAPELVALLVGERLDMVVGARANAGAGAYRRGHQWGNRMFNRLLKTFFASEFRDIFSGYRVFSERFVKSFPALSEGFEIETEMAVHAITMRMPVAEVDCDYKERAAGTVSKLRTYRDGARILRTMLRFLRQHKPLVFFGIIAGFLTGLGGALFYPVLSQYLATGLVPRMPTLIVSMGLAVLAALSLTCGLILDTTMRTQCEIRRLIYLNISRRA